MRHTKSHTANRRSHHALKVARFETCPKCNAKHLMHRVCVNCGNYRGRMVVDVLKKTLKKTQKAEAKNDARKPKTEVKAEAKPEAKKEAKAAKEVKAEKSEKKEKKAK